MLNTKSARIKLPKLFMLIAPLLVVSLLVQGCGALGTPTPKTYTIGIAQESPALTATLVSFKAKMTELGYVEGKNITYVQGDVVGTDAQLNDAEMKKFMDQKTDLILAMGTAPTVAAKKAVEGTGVPVVFSPVINPIGEGIVTDLRHPGGNLTGVQIASSAPKALDLLLQIAPGTKQVYAIYNPVDQVAVSSVKFLPDVAAKLGVELKPTEVGNGDEELAAIRALPQDSALLFMVSPSLNPSVADALKLAAELHIPTGLTSNIGIEGAVFSNSTNLPQVGEQAAVLVDKILKGAKPGDLPVGTAEFVLVINAKVAQALGITLPDSLLKQANDIIH